jgi:hypothetical protein
MPNPALKRAVLFWPDESETVASHDLRQSRHRLRQLLGEANRRQLAQQAYETAPVIIHRLAETIAEEGLRKVFLTAGPVPSVLERNERTESLQKHLS